MLLTVRDMIPILEKVKEEKGDKIKISVYGDLTDEEVLNQKFNLELDTYSVSSGYMSYDVPIIEGRSEDGFSYAYYSYSTGVSQMILDLIFEV